MASLFIIKSIGINKHVTAIYVIFNIIILGLNYEDRFIKTIITKKIYIVKNLKAKMLIKINVINSKEINISITKKIIYVNFYEVDIFIFTKLYAKNLISRVIYVKSIIFISFYSTAVLPIYYI